MGTTVSGIDGLKSLAGKDLGRTGWRAVTQSRVDAFADATDDHQWIHVDPVRAAEGPFGGTIAHGYLTLSLVIPFLSELLTVEGISMAVNYGLNRVRFPAPVPVGAQIRGTGRIGTVADVPGGVQATVDLAVELSGVDKPGCVAQAVYRYYA